MYIANSVLTLQNHITSMKSKIIITGSLAYVKYHTTLFVSIGEHHYNTIVLFFYR